MNNNYKLVSKILKEMMNSSVSFSAYESLPTRKKRKKKVQLFRPAYPIK